MNFRTPEEVKLGYARIVGFCGLYQRNPSVKTIWWLCRRNWDCGHLCLTRHRHEGKWLESSRVTPLQRILASPPGLVPRPVLNYNLVGIFLLSSVLISCLASGISTLFITFLLRIFKDVLIRTCHSCWLVVATFEVTSKPFLCSWGQTLLFTLLLTDHLTDLGKNFESKRAHQD